VTLAPDRRLAAALVRSGEWSGYYEGLDIVPTGIAWCKRHIASSHPNTHFTLADIYNGEYNPSGKMRASEYQFPYNDQTFDLAVLISVFTHMLPDDMEQYVAEVARVLRQDACCVATYTLLDADSLEAMLSGRSIYRFERIGLHWSIDARHPELAVAYEELYVRDLFERHGLSPSTYHGTWSGRALASTSTYIEFEQDFVVGTKNSRN
jgi:SAM-dependent methyltransferase